MRVRIPTGGRAGFESRQHGRNMNHVCIAVSVVAQERTADTDIVDCWLILPVLGLSYWLEKVNCCNTRHH